MNWMCHSSSIAPACKCGALSSDLILIIQDFFAVVVSKVLFQIKRNNSFHILREVAVHIVLILWYKSTFKSWTWWHNAYNFSTLEAEAEGL
jgi:hypothetical protein